MLERSVCLCPPEHCMVIVSYTSLIVFSLARKADLGEQMWRTEYGRTRFEIGSVGPTMWAWCQTSDVGRHADSDSSTCRKPLCLQQLNKGARLRVRRRHECRSKERPAGCRVWVGPPSRTDKGAIFNEGNDTRRPLGYRGRSAHVPRQRRG